MRGLAIDTALGACTAAVFEGGRVLAARSEPMERGHQERLGGLVREVLAEAGLKGPLMGRLDRILVTVGPGSFTGLRVGLAFAEGLGFALDRPVTGISTLAAVAASTGESGRVLAAIDARRGQVYLAAYDEDEETSAPEAVSVEAARARLESLRACGPVRLVGSGAALIDDPSDILAPTSEGLARLAMRPLPASARPLYLRAPDALPPSRRPGEARSTLEVCEALARLHAEAFAGVERSWSTPEFASLMTTPGVTIRGDDQGFVVLRVAADEAEILTLAVRPGDRRTGRGRALVEEAARLAAEAGATRLLLEVAEDNIAGRGLYGATGFAEVGRRPAYYSRRESRAADALVLARDLSAGSPAA